MEECPCEDALLTIQMHMVIEYTRCRAKKIPNLSILRLINEFKGIPENKGRIHRELGKFEIYL